MSEIVTERVCSTSDLEDGQMKQFKLAGKPVLMSRVKGKFYASGHLCTHNKAFLKDGVLTADGKVTCPWHGACFDVATGDIEETPALDALPIYKVEVSGEDVVVTADTKLLAAARRVPPTCTHQSDNSDTVVIIGGGSAAMGAIAGLREHNYTGRIVMVSAEPHLPIDRVKLSKGTDVDVDKILLRDQAYFDACGIELHLGKVCEKVDPASQTVRLNDGKELKYNSLILATGGTPRFFWGEEAKKLSNVFLFRSAEDAESVSDAVKSANSPPHILIVGSSFIGMEAAAAYIKLAASITVIGMEKVPFERVLGEKVGLALQKLHESRNVSFRMGVVLDKFESENGRCTAVVLKSGERLPCDVAIVGAGVAPTTEFLKSTFQLERDGALLADEYLHVQNTKNVYAAGDIVRFPYHGENVRIEHWNVAQYHGRVIAYNILGKKTAADKVPYFWTSQYGKSLRYCGHALSYDDVHIEGSLDGDPKFVAYYSKGSDILAVASLGADPAVSHAAELMRLNRMPKIEEIKSGKTITSFPVYVAEGKSSLSSSSERKEAPSEKKSGQTEGGVGYTLPIAMNE